MAKEISELTAKIIELGKKKVLPAEIANMLGVSTKLVVKSLSRARQRGDINHYYVANAKGGKVVEIKRGIELDETYIDISRSPRGEFRHVLAVSRRGDKIVYHKGPFCSGHHKAEANDANVAGKVRLFQKRLGPSMFAYIAVAL